MVLTIFKKKPKKKLILLSSSCSDIMLWNFNKIIETGNYRYLIPDWDGIERIEINQEEAKKAWNKIYSEYCNLTLNNKAISYYKSVQKLIYFETRYEICSKLILEMLFREMTENVFLKYIKTLRTFDIPYNKDIKDVDCLEKASLFLKATKNQIELLSHEIKELSAGGEKISFEKEIVSAEQALGRNEIDPKKTSVTKWIYIIEKIKDKVQQQIKENAKRK